MSDDVNVPKNIETVVEDIYDMLDGVISGNSVELDKQQVALFGARMANKLENALKSRTRKRKPKTLYMSEVGRPCRRQLWYDLDDNTTKEPLQPHVLIKFLYGDILEELVLTLVELSGHKVTDDQKECEIELPFGWKIRGYLDAKIDDEVVDVKSASSYSFKKFKSGKLSEDDPFGYIGQLSFYNIAENVSQGETSFLVIDKQNGTICRDVYEADNLTLETVLGDVNAQMDFVKMLEHNEPPERKFTAVADGKGGNMKLPVNCSYCGYKTECWQDANGGDGLRAFAYSAGPRFLTEVKNTPNVPEIPLKENAE